MGAIVPIFYWIWATENVLVKMIAIFFVSLSGKNKLIEISLQL